jgi:hypothetical protein
LFRQPFPVVGIAGASVLEVLQETTLDPVQYVAVEAKAALRQLVPASSHPAAGWLRTIQAFRFSDRIISFLMDW